MHLWDAVTRVLLRYFIVYYRYRTFTGVERDEERRFHLRLDKIVGVVVATAVVGVHRQPIPSALSLEYRLPRGLPSRIPRMRPRDICNCCIGWN